MPSAISAIALTLALAGCATGPVKDGPDAQPPAGLDRVPDAVPRVEPLRVGGPNKPYEVLGRRYVPLAADVPLRERGLASWYGRKFHGRPTASGEPYDMYAMTAAHKTMPLPSYARVRNPANGREVIVRVNDRGPFHDDRVIDLSYTAALRLGVLGGVAPVEVERLTHAQIAAGTWRRGDEPSLATARPAATGEGVPVDARWTAPVAARTPSDDAARASLSAGWWLQLGAFRQPEGAAVLADRVRREAAAVAGEVAVEPAGAGGLWRVHAGPYPSRERALQAADALRRQLALAPLVVERR